MFPISHYWEVNNQQYKKEAEKENCERLNKGGKSIKYASYMVFHTAMELFQPVL